MSDRLLLEDMCEDSNISLLINESSSDGKIKWRSKLSEANKINKNRRYYSFEVLDENVKRLQEIVKARGLVGNLDHLESSNLTLNSSALLITKLWWDHNNLMGEGEILSTPHGKVLRALLNDGVRIGMSSRSVGSGQTNSEGVLHIDKSLRVITWDAVADPSTENAFCEKIIQKENFSEKSYNSSIDKNILIAAIGGIVREQSRKIKRGLLNG